MRYTKQLLTLQQQIDVLKQRGLIVENEEEARNALDTISYFRLAGYWRLMEADRLQKGIFLYPSIEKYLRMWQIGMVTQWRESDKQLTGNALVPLLIGRQSCGKTRFCKILLPPELRDYYNDKINFKNEFDKTTKGQQVVLKYLLSSAEVKFRPPYGKTIKQYRRYTSFIGPLEDH